MPKICPICRAQFPTKAALAAHMSSHRGTGRRKRGAGGISGGTTNLALKEFWGAAGNGITTIDCRPAASKLPKLVNLAAIYETYKLLSWTVHVVHTGGSASTGSYFMGVSYKADKHPNTMKGVAALSPVICKSIHQDSSLSVPVAKLMGQPWLDNTANSPGAVMLWNDSSDSLQVWVTYKVAFTGPTSVSQVQSYDRLFKFNHTTRTWEDANGSVVRNINLDFDTYGELETGGADDTILESVWRAWTSVSRTARELHRAWSISVGVVHFLMSAGAVALPILNAPAVLHLQRRPFRTSRSEWVRLGLRCVKGQDSGFGGGASTSTERPSQADSKY